MLFRSPDLDHPVTLELGVRLRYGSWIHPEIGGEVPHRWEGIFGAKCTPNESSADGIHDLHVERSLVGTAEVNLHCLSTVVVLYNTRNSSLEPGWCQGWQSASVPDVVICVRWILWASERVSLGDAYGRAEMS